jgi:hypothetical protein
MAANGVSDIFSELLSIIEIGNRLNRALKPGSKPLDPSQFKNFTIPYATEISPNVGTGTQNVLQYTVPQNMAFLCTFITIKALQPQVGSGLNPSGYPDDFSGSVLSQAWLTQDGVANPITRPNAYYLGLANRPVCFLFSSGKTINLLVSIQNGLISLAGIFVSSALHGWMGGSDVLQVFQQFQTLIGNPVGFPGGSGGGTNTSGPTVPTGNVPF